MIGRIVRPADFQRVLGAPQRSRSAHFAIHYVAGLPSRPKASMPGMELMATMPSLSPELSTDEALPAVPAVDEPAVWLGLVIPKRHAKRAVTRNLIKRQVRAVLLQHACELPSGLWVVRLRAPFDKQQFHSPGSDPLRACAREELSELFGRAIHAPLAAHAFSRSRPRQKN